MENKKVKIPKPKGTNPASEKLPYEPPKLSVYKMKIKKIKKSIITRWSCPPCIFKE
ncbi:MAG: hypothetical protein HGB26_07425 [Desulfobulbaceae bacterium]|nr:hypothetical protein [Desulfobulbaceae bacterium]